MLGTDWLMIGGRVIIAFGRRLFVIKSLSFD
jgi:hypothetical protein